MQRSPLVKVEWASSVKFVPTENKRRPYLVAYEGGTREDGTFSPAGGRYFASEEEAVAWRAAVAGEMASGDWG